MLPDVLYATMTRNPPSAIMEDLRNTLNTPGGYDEGWVVSSQPFLPFSLQGAEMQGRDSSEGSEETR